MSERTVREQMRYAFGPQVADHIAALTQIISETLVPAMRDNAKRIIELEARIARVEETLAATLKAMAGDESPNVEG